MNIMIITPQYVPDGGPSSPLFKMLCDELVKRGHQVTLVAAVPHYPSGRIPAEFRHSWIQKTEEDNITVFRVRLPSINRANLLLRMLQFSIYQLGAAWVAARQNCDVVLITNPAIETFLPFFVSVTLKKTPSVFFVADVYPDVGIELGIFRHRIIIAIVKFLEQHCLRGADLVWIFSQSFRAPLQRLGIAPEKQELIYGWVDTEFIQPLPRQNAFATEHNLSDKFVTLYAGNIGLSQGLDTVLLVAKELLTDANIVFLFVGEGAGCETLMQQAQQLSLDNVRFLPFQPRERVPEVLATADLSLLSLQEGIGNGSLPSKFFSYLASARPILAILDEQSDAAELVKQSEAGIVVSPNNVEAIVTAICEIKSNSAQLETMGRNGRAYVEAHHSPQEAAQQVEAILTRVLR